jgi:DNA (cytosine-5-)-methyltransferase
LGKKIRALDLFAGAGGFSYGMEQSGIEVVAAIEFDKKIAKTYQQNHKNTILINDDIRNISVYKNDSSNSIEELVGSTKFDIIFGGPPCQGFSMAGNRIRKNSGFFEDERNFLFLEFLRMVSDIKPKVFIIENVPGILNFENGRVRDEIHKKFSELGYDVSSRVLSAEAFGVPQKRKRAIFIGNRMGLDSTKLFPEKTHEKGFEITVWQAISDLPSLQSGEGSELTEYVSAPQNEYQAKMRNTSDGQFYNHVASVHQDKTLEILRLVKPGQTLKDLPEKYHTKSVHSGAYGRMLKDEPSYTLTTRINTPSVGRITHPEDDRTITPREAARLQSFPDNYYFIGDITTVGMQIGNSVPPILAEKIGASILEKVFRNDLD